MATKTSLDSTNSVNVPDKGKEIKDLPPTEIVDLCQEAFIKTAEYLNGELEGTIDDYKLLEKMNKITDLKYCEMKYLTQSMKDILLDLNVKYKQLQPFFDQIDNISEQVASLEQAAYSIDRYSKRLGLVRAMTSLLQTKRPNSYKIFRHFYLENCSALSGVLFPPGKLQLSHSGKVCFFLNHPTKPMHLSICKTIFNRYCNSISTIPSTTSTIYTPNY